MHFLIQQRRTHFHTIIFLQKKNQKGQKHKKPKPIVTNLKHYPECDDENSNSLDNEKVEKVGKPNSRNGDERQKSIYQVTGTPVSARVVKEVNHGFKAEIPKVPESENVNVDTIQISGIKIENKKAGRPKHSRNRGKKTLHKTIEKQTVAATTTQPPPRLQPQRNYCVGYLLANPSKKSSINPN